jgi:predicted dehydrogenase
MSRPSENLTLSRRRFLGSTTLAGTSLLAGRMLAADAPAGANDRLSIGMIGVGDRGMDHVKSIASLAKDHNVEITAVCDVWRPNLDRAAAAVKEKWGKSPRTSTRFADLFGKDVDAVVIATPDFGHTPIMIETLAAGKDVYVEKPMSLEVEGANRALDLAREKNAVVQVGTQRRSDGQFLAAAKLLAGGVLGKISRVSAEYNFNEARWARGFDDCKAADVDWDAYLFNRPNRDFDPRLLRRWQLYNMCTNGLSGLWMTHYVDAVNMLLGTTYPTSVVALGGDYVWKDGREHGDTFRALLDYPEGFLMAWGMGLGNEAGRYWTIHGTQGTLDLEAWMLLRAGGKDTSIKDQRIPPEPTTSHMGNWFECIRTRKRPRADIEFGHQHSLATIMAAEALHSGQRQKYDAPKRAIVAG